MEVNRIVREPLLCLLLGDETVLRISRHFHICSWLVFLFTTLLFVFLLTRLLFGGLLD
jgi:hypothetical protein